LSIYVSSYGLGFSRIDQTVKCLAEAGIREIELTGGSDWYADLEEGLFDLQKEFDLTFRCHNYFPPPKKHFVLNLASLDDEVWKMSKDHCQKALTLSGKMGAREYGVHAGFLIDIKLDELGKAVENRELFDRERALDRFAKTVEELNEFSSNLGLQLYMENNVINGRTLAKFGGINPLLLCDSIAVTEMQKRVKFSLLLDVAHLKVSCHSLNLDFEQELLKLAEKSDYLHISDNDGLADSNETVFAESDLGSLLKKVALEKKKITIEIYSGMDGIQTSLKTMRELSQ
jgi:sugar phosphate isomerase/epimerase